MGQAGGPCNEIDFFDPFWIRMLRQRQKVREAVVLTAGERVEGTSLEKVLSWALIDNYCTIQQQDSCVYDAAMPPLVFQKFCHTFHIAFQVSYDFIQPSCEVPTTQRVDF